MIKRLGSDEIAVAVLDGANPNVLYEFSVRHAYCLPVVSLIEKKGDGAGPELPFDIRDVAPMEYPQLSEGETWSRKIENQFVGDLVERARSALNIYEPAEHFRKSLNVIANSKKMGMVFGQKTVQLRQASKELEDVRRLLRKDYDINDTIPPDAAGRFFDMVNRTWHSMFIGNDLLGSMLEGVGSVPLRLQPVRRRCNAICVKVNELAGKLSELARDLERQARAENADEDSGEVTRDRIESQISDLMNEIDGLNKKIQAIEGLLR